MKTFTLVSCAVFLLLYSCNSATIKSFFNSDNQNQEYHGPIIDMHIHAFHKGNPLFGMTHPPTLRGKTYIGVSSPKELQEKTLEKFNQHNIVKAVVTNGQLWKTEQNDGILIAHNTTKSIEDLKQLYKSNQLQVIAEMAPFYTGIQANDSTLLPYFALAQDLNIPVGFHILPGGPNYGIRFLPKMLGDMRAKNANPLQLEEVLVQFPKLRVYIGHGGWPYIEDVKALMYMYPNVYVDISVLNWILPQKEFENYLKSLITAGFGKRILFGSDQMVWPETIDDAVQSVNSAQFLSYEQKEDIFFDNAAEFLQLEEQEIRKLKND